MKSLAIYQKPPERSDLYKEFGYLSKTSREVGPLIQFQNDNSRDTQKGKGA